LKQYLDEKEKVKKLIKMFLLNKEKITNISENDLKIINDISNKEIEILFG